MRVDTFWWRKISGLEFGNTIFDLMEEYIKKYPKAEKDIYALAYAFGYEEADRICKEALDLNKRIRIIIDPEKLDYLEYKLI